MEEIGRNPTTHWSRKNRYFIAFAIAPYVCAKIYLFLAHPLHVKTPVLASSFVHRQALVSGDYAAPSAIAIAYACTIPIHLAWFTVVLANRSRGKNMSLIWWIALVALALASFQMAYVPTKNTGMPLEHYSTLAQISMKSELIFAGMLFVTNYLACAIPCLALATLVQFTNTRITRKRKNE